MAKLSEERKEETAIMQDILKKLKEIVKNPQASIPSYGGKAQNAIEKAESKQKKSSGMVTNIQDQQTSINLDDSGAAYSDDVDLDPATKDAQKDVKKQRKRINKKMKKVDGVTEL